MCLATHRNVRQVIPALRHIGVTHVKTARKHKCSYETTPFFRLAVCRTQCAVVSKLYCFFTGIKQTFVGVSVTCRLPLSHTNKGKRRSGSPRVRSAHH